MTQEDMGMMDFISNKLMEFRAITFGGNGGKSNETTDALLSAIEWLAKQQVIGSFRPSKEQMCALKDAVETYRVRHNASTSGDNIFKGLESLYNDLKKLM